MAEKKTSPLDQQFARGLDHHDSYGVALDNPGLSVDEPMRAYIGSTPEQFAHGALNELKRTENSHLFAEFSDVVLKFVGKGTNKPIVSIESIGLNSNQEQADQLLERVLAITNSKS